MQLILNLIKLLVLCDKDIKVLITMGTFLNYVIRLGWVGVQKRCHL